VLVLGIGVVGCLVVWLFGCLIFLIGSVCYSVLL